MIFVDSQEVFSDILVLLDAMGVKYELVPLMFGDFHVTGKNGLMIFERKEVKDYVGSLLSGHLSDQLTRMSEEFEWSVLLVEGSINDALAEGSIPRKTYFSEFLSVTMKRAKSGKRGGITLIPVESNWDTATILERAQARMDDPEGLIRTPYIGAPQVLGGNPQLRSLCAIKGVGEIIGRGLLEYFGTTGRIATASVDELKSVRNVGDVVADSIFRFFRTKYVVESEKK